MSRVLLLSSFFLCSCGYHTVSHHPPAVDVASISKDHTGQLRSCLIEALAASSWNYDPEHPDFELRVAVVQDETSQEDRDIGVRYARNPLGEESRMLIATERRAVMVAQVELVDLKTGKVLFEPLFMRANYDYEFDSDLLDDKAVGTTPLVKYSFGQMENATSARETAFSLLGKRLARKIIDYLELAHSP